MKKQDLKKLKRIELARLLVDEMEKNAMLIQKVQELEAELEKERLICNEKGNLAEAALQVAGVLEAAENAARLYLKNIQEQNPLSSNIPPESEIEAAAKTDSGTERETSAQAQEAEQEQTENNE